MIAQTIDMLSRHPELGNAPIGLSDNTVFGLLGACPYEWTADDKQGVLAFPNARLAARILHCRPDDVPTNISALKARFCDDAIAVRKRAIATLSWDDASFQIDYQILAFDGRQIWVEERAVRIAGEGATPTKVIGVISDIQSRKLAEQTAGYRAAYDGCTGLWNRHRLSEGLNQLMAFCHRYERDASFLSLKIINLDDINTNYGYEAGDRLLRAVGERLSASIRAPDICGRLSGAIFGVGLTDCTDVQMPEVAARILETLSKTPFRSPDGDIYAKIVIGGYALGPESRSAEDAFECSASALEYSEQHDGAFVAYSHDLPNIAPRSKSTAYRKVDIIDALNERRIILVYQPIVYATDYTIHHYECLLRLRREDGELVSAADFIVAAERLGCVHLLDRRALEIGAKALLENKDVHLALNISASTVKSKETADAYLLALRSLGANTKRVTIELTETVALEDPAMAARFSVEAQALGCQFAIDDFGAGFTSFRNLMAIEADEIKIDGSFIRDLSLTPHKQVFVRMMVDLAQTFGVKTVAEMVSSREDAEILSRTGVDYLQSYIFGVPGPLPKVS